MDTVGVGPASVAWAATSGDRPQQSLRGRSLVAGLVELLFPGARGWTMGSAVCSRCGKRHGAVELLGVPAVASVSYARDLVVAATAPSSAAVRLGVDVEWDAADVTRTRDLELLLGATDKPVLRLWTQVESVLKADGRGLLIEPGAVRFDGNTAVIGAGRTRYQVRGVDGPPGYVISLAWCDAEASAASPGRATR